MAVKKLRRFRSVDWITRPLGRDDLEGGLPAPWMPAGLRILHAMWENPEGDHTVSHAGAHAAALEAGEHVPAWIGRVTGVSLNMEDPPAGWRRLRWGEVAARLGVELDASQGILESQLRPLTDQGSWPVSILPPPEGTLDMESFLALAEVLSAHSSGRTVAYTMRGVLLGDARGRFASGTVDEIVGLSLDRRYTPNNWWPRDRSWLVWTDFDLMTSAVFGSPQLVADLSAVAGLETLPYRDVWWPEASVLNS